MSLNVDGAPLASASADGVGAPVVIRPNDPNRVAMGSLRIFPADLIQDLALDLGRSADAYIPTTEVEAAVARFVVALELRAWKLLLPGSGPRS